AELIAPLPHLRVLGQEAIHRAFGTDVLPGVEQRGIDLRRGVIHEARLMQQREDRAALARTERAGRGAPRRRGPRGPAAAIVGRAREPERGARGGDAQPRPDLGDRRHHEVSVASGVPSNAATCFCSSTSASARSARFFHRLISRSCSASFLSRGSATRRTGPRFFGAPASSPRSRAVRHVVRCEEYNPSRRNNAPTAPGVLHASASRTIFRLYSAVNRRRVAFAVTSISGPPGARSSTLIVLQSLLALDTNLNYSRTMKDKSHRATRRCYRSGVWTLRGTQTRRLDGHSLYSASHVPIRAERQAGRRRVRHPRRQLGRWPGLAEGDRHPTRADQAPGRVCGRRAPSGESPAWDARIGP